MSLVDLVGREYEVFGGQAGDVRAGAAEVGVFDYGGADAEGGGARPAEVFAGFAGADGEGVVVRWRGHRNSGMKEVDLLR